MTSTFTPVAASNSRMAAKHATPARGKGRKNKKKEDSPPSTPPRTAVTEQDPAKRQRKLMKHECTDCGTTLVSARHLWAHRRSFPEKACVDRAPYRPLPSVTRTVASIAEAKELFLAGKLQNQDVVRVQGTVRVRGLGGNSPPSMLAISSKTGVRRMCPGVSARNPYAALPPLSHAHTRTRTHTHPWALW